MSPIASKVLSEEHLKAIGLVAAEWSYTEVFLEQLIWEVASLEDFGSAITTHISSENRLDILASVTDLISLDESVKNRIYSLIATIKELRPLRNNIVHSVWLTNTYEVDGKYIKDMVAPKATKTKARGKVVTSKTPTTAKEISDLAVKIGTLALDLYHLQKEIEALRSNPELSALTE